LADGPAPMLNGTPFSRYAEMLQVATRGWLAAGTAPASASVDSIKKTLCRISILPLIEINLQ
jgi:hypothetical protein